VTPNFEDHMEMVLRYIGPIAVGVNAGSSSFLAYSGGIFDSKDCEQGANHALLITGYGQKVEKHGRVVKYFIARNSWGTGWGENGYVRIKRGPGYRGAPGVCGIARSASVALGGKLVTELDFSGISNKPDDSGPPHNRFCAHFSGLKSIERCIQTANWLEQNFALTIGSIGVFLAVLAGFALSTDCRKRQQRIRIREKKQKTQEDARLSQQQLNGLDVESDPLLKSGNGTSSYGGTN
jgi:hypothetical protein